MALQEYQKTGGMGEKLIEPKLLINIYFFAEEKCTLV